jgi:hypothetical protein
LGIHRNRSVGLLASMSALPAISSRTDRLLFALGLLLAMFPIVVSSETIIEMFERISPGSSAHDSSAVEILLMPVFMLLCYLHGFSFMIGTGICVWCFGRFLGLPERPMVPRVVLVPLLCDAYVFAQALPFLAVPRGTGIRPMGWVAFALLLGLGMTVFEWFYVARQLRSQPNSAFVILGYVLSLLPIPIVMISLGLMASIKGFVLEQ